MPKNLIDTILEALTTDGAHHKQWFLEEILRTVAKEQFNDIKDKYNWEEGIAP